MNPLHNAVPIDHLGISAVFVDREQMRRKTDRRFLQRLPDLHPLFDADAVFAAPPEVFDWSHGEKIKYPMQGNDQVGDCYYSAILHMVQTFVGQYADQPTWPTADIIARYEVLSRGDNGLSDSDVYPEWVKGILGPNGPHKIIDSLLVDPSNEPLLTEAMWRCEGVLFTLSWPDTWMKKVGTNVVLDADGGRSDGGHAVILTGRKANGQKDLRTWGISPPPVVTEAGIMANDPEIICVFSVEQFDPVTHLTAAGFTWDQQRAWWIQHGGKDVGAAPWSDPVPPPVPPVPPSPPVPPVPPTPPEPVPFNPPLDVVTTGSLVGATVTIPGFFGSKTYKVDGGTIQSTGEAFPHQSGPPPANQPTTQQWSCEFTYQSLDDSGEEAVFQQSVPADAAELTADLVSMGMHAKNASRLAETIFAFKDANEPVRALVAVANHLAVAEAQGAIDPGNLAQILAFIMAILPIILAFFQPPKP